jgi:hypothetical protein
MHINYHGLGKNDQNPSPAGEGDPGEKYIIGGIKKAGELAGRAASALLGDADIGDEDADLMKSDIFREMAETPPEPMSPLERKRDLQKAFDAVLSKLGSGAIAPEEGEDDFHYLATLATQAAQYGPPDRREINRLGLPPRVLAVVAQQDLDHARAEIERPRHSLRPGETREVQKIDRSGRPITEFYNCENSPGFWMNEFKPPLESYVSGGTAGINTNPSGYYSFDKSHLPEVQRAQRQLDWENSTAGKIAKVYRESGKEVPREFMSEAPNYFQPPERL